ncbi:redox-sensing transcriptional repressor Rex [Levilinea saccharolytica]|uniref:Redox-sensing transcriptional repressor Rex n=1 Tax=Levilinea saccharolytica TaxID=229921 RepID=A0A0P6XEW7_9CHLR|nr:redox-sensing transcriptional repressor Rex [Levilinea saccharolytica]KPL81782.1 REX family transcriptional regulator [Levilinea saccharolytica]GAP17927.1 AT-rich DNA-binding protein [Levilinea saccharolytica]
MNRKLIIPDIVVGRLPRYLQALQRLQKRAVQTTSSKELGDILGISAAQIRKDLSQFGEFGKQGTGYSVPFLIDRLEDILKLKHDWDIALVGVGDLGHAIIRYQGFSNRGFCVSMAFDNDPEKIGTSINGLIVENIQNMPARIQEAQVKIAMLTVPAAFAQQVAEDLVKAGVTAILNYAPLVLSLPKHVQVEYIDPIISLQHMTYYLE